MCPNLIFLFSSKASPWYCSSVIGWYSSISYEEKHTKNAKDLSTFSTYKFKQLRNHGTNTKYAVKHVTFDHYPAKQYFCFALNFAQSVCYYAYFWPKLRNMASKQLPLQHDFLWLAYPEYNNWAKKWEISNKLSKQNCIRQSRDYI